MDDSGLAGVAQLVGHFPTNPKVMGSIPSQGTCLGHGRGSQSGHGREGTN